MSITVLISKMNDDQLLDRYLDINLQTRLELKDRVLVDLIKIEWNKRHPGDPMPTSGEFPKNV